MSDFDFYITSMPSSRKADYYLGCLDASVFIDFNKTKNDRIVLVRISFDGFGCCNLPKDAAALDAEDSTAFKAMFKKGELNQAEIERLVKTAIRLNKSSIWNEALQRYNLL